MWISPKPNDIIGIVASHVHNSEERLQTLGTMSLPCVWLNVQMVNATSVSTSTHSESTGKE